jgi:hypothetical protein
MGMDVYGNKPKNEQGEYFRANVWYWRPLWSFVEDIHPAIAAKVPEAHYNSGDGLNAKDSLALANLIKKDLETGVVENYIQHFKEEIEKIPLDDCKYCDQKGYRSFTDSSGNESMKPCNACHGTLKVKSVLTWYQMDIEVFKDFQIFLQNCGGFRIC